VKLELEEDKEQSSKALRGLCNESRRAFRPFFSCLLDEDAFLELLVFVEGFFALVFTLSVLGKTKGGTSVMAIGLGGVGVESVAR
jgi:hypothetical protein